MTPRNSISNPLIGALLILGLCTSGLARAESVTLKEEAYVKGPKVLLGDIAKIEGISAEKLASIELSDAALPGAQKRFNAALVETRLRNAGVNPSEIEMHGSTSVIATTLSNEVGGDQVASSLEDFIKKNMPWDRETTRIEVTPPNFAITAPDGEVQFAWTPAPDYQYVGSGAFRGELLVDGMAQRTVNVRAKVEPYVSVMVASRDIMRGTAVGPADMEIRKMQLSSAPEGAVTDPQRALGLVARKTIFPGEFLTLRDLQEKIVVTRNQLVELVVNAGAVSLRGRAKATMDGRVGDTIVCVNPDSKEQVQGVVMQDGSVVVE